MSRTRPGPYAVRVLLSGWAALLPRGMARISDLPPNEAAEVGALWRGGLPAIAQLWRAHGPWLRREATRLGILPTCSSGSKPVYFAEMIAGAMPTTERARLPARKGKHT
jgi:hypothetical protein